MDRLERHLCSPQSSTVSLEGGGELINFCSNNYLGLADHPELIAAAKTAMDERGYGLSSVRFICGTLDVHRHLEQSLSEFLKMEDTILYSSCFDANAGLFETLLTSEDVIISDRLNHASIIDGVRLCKAQRKVYGNNNMDELREQLRRSQGARFRLIATDGVFSMDGLTANLAAICELADEYDALVMVDDSHGVGVLGETGGGSPQLRGVEGRIDILTGTLGKALGGASGGYTCGHKTVIEWLRQRSRPYLFSNALAPAVLGASLKALELIQREESRDWFGKLSSLTDLLRQKLQALGFSLIEGVHPIVPVMIRDAVLAKTMASELLERGLLVTALAYPVVPKGSTRIRLQVSLSHSQEQIEAAVHAFKVVGQKMGMVP